jgi:hypothetical protein
LNSCDNFHQENLSYETYRLLDVTLPLPCVFHLLKEIDAFKYQHTIKKLDSLFQKYPPAILKMVEDWCAIEALGVIIWWVENQQEMGINYEANWREMS